jgi:hypothetical protein
LYRHYRDKSAAEVAGLFRQSHAALLAAIGRFDDVGLLEPYVPDDPNSTPQIDKIRWNTYEHSDEHAGWIRETLGKE